ncbi:unnamed protein product [Nesidiocoris tenuis]|uniref:Uncharacterized protein n=1 Tax=Nesidiocoris tenuis TaxID=355587 RepID=A0A6H5GAU3_9HEMI|nr:unnamed protein product [Nesidiocoris tenuis]
MRSSPLTTMIFGVLVRTGCSRLHHWDSRLPQVRRLFRWRLDLPDLRKQKMTTVMVQNCWADEDHYGDSQCAVARIAHRSPTTMPTVSDPFLSPFPAYYVGIQENASDDNFRCLSEAAESIMFPRIGPFKLIISAPAPEISATPSQWSHQVTN